MAKHSAATIHKKSMELSDFVSSPKMLAALEKAGKDKQILRQAKADPKAYLKGEGVPPPPRAGVTISEAKVSIGGKVKVTVTVTVCWKFASWAKVCADVEVESGAEF